MKNLSYTACVCLFLAFPLAAETIRHDFTITSEDGLKIFIRELHDTTAPAEQ